MSADWSEDIVIANLSDEPALSDELSTLVQRVESCEPQQTPRIVLNFGDVTYVNSSNIAQLLRLRRLLDGVGKGMKLCSVGDQVWSVFMVTGLDKVFDFTENPAAAIAMLQIEGADEAESA